MGDLRDRPTLRGKLERDAPLARFTSWRAGGRAELLFRPADRDDLAGFVRTLPAATPIHVLGLGSNTLVRDGGVRGAVIVMHDPGAALAVADGLIYAEAGVASPKVARLAARLGCEDAAFLAGVPGTLGGALAMNAGCYGGETWNHVVRVEVLGRDGRFEVRPRTDYAIGYRSVRRADGTPPDGIFTAAWLSFSPGDAARARARIRELLAKRIASQPLSLPNAGSVFRNPPGDHAARLIEAAGLKGHAIGGARVSELHANFIVNPGGRARASDIEALIEHVRATVRERFGVDLETEVRIVGERPQGEGR
ncbi:MAG TPA: UDP-N-acetylmuramate dehydrogenase [Casimicrobiaceae bacterium]|nr:UDP-N-acetylmuramate dehydrogenase [Casimicrobiaceae bacterium]